MNTMQARGRHIRKETAAYQRRQAMTSGLPTLSQLESYPHDYVEFVVTPSGKAIRRFYIKTQTHANRYYCYIPTPAERGFDSMPVEGATLNLRPFAALRAVSREGKPAIEAPIVVKRAKDVAYVYGFEIAIVTFE